MSDPPQSSIKHSIIFQPKESNERYSKETFAEMTKKNLPDRLKNLPVQRTVLTKQGKGFMVFPDQKTRDLAVKALESDCSVTVQNSEKMSILPKIKIVGIPTDNFDRNDKETLRSEILNKNSYLKALVKKENDLKVLFTHNGFESTQFTAIIMVSPEIREALCTHGDKIYIGLSSCKIFDHFHIIQCYRCQRFGHKSGSENCPLKDNQSTICLYCEGNHNSKDCNTKNTDHEDYKKYKCSNCFNSKNVQLKKECNHSSNSHKCPILQAELKRLINRTAGSQTEQTFSKNSLST